MKTIGYYVERISMNILKFKNEENVEADAIWLEFNEAFNIEDDAKLLRTLRVIDNRLNKLIDERAAS